MPSSRRLTKASRDEPKGRATTPSFADTAARLIRVGTPSPRRKSSRSVFDIDAPARWTGPVVRRDPASIRDPRPHLTWRCVNPYCRAWTSDGAHLTGRCNLCDTPRPE